MRTRSFPIRMWVSGQLQNPLGIELAGSTIEYYGVEGIVDISREGEGDSRPILQSLSISLTDQCKSQLASQVPSSWSSEHYGVEHYLKAVEIIKQHALELLISSNLTTVVYFISLTQGYTFQIAVITLLHV